MLSMHLECLKMPKTPTGALPPGPQLYELPPRRFCQMVEAVLASLGQLHPPRQKAAYGPASSMLGFQL